MAPAVMVHEEEVELFSRRLIRATWKLVLGSFLLHVRRRELLTQLTGCSG